jgi:hypothetical protein
MKIRFADSPQFVVEAETDQDRQILKMFTEYGYKNNQVFHMHGCCWQSGLGCTSFNFGYIKPTKKILFKRILQALKG